MRYPGFIGPSYKLQSVNVDCQRTVNFYPEIDELGTGKEGEVASLVPTPGLRRLLTLPESPTRGGWRASNGEVFAVGGTKLYRISSSFVATELGSLNTSSGPVSMADNGTYLVLVDGTNGYSWNIDTSTFAQITDPAFKPADQVAYQDGYFLFNRTGTDEFFFVDDENLVFDGLDIAFASGAPDNLAGLISHEQKLFLFGTQSTEVFYDDGATPWSRIQGAVIPVGLKAAFSIAKGAGSIFWLGGDETGSGIVYRTEGYQPKRISTPAIESVIRGLDQEELSDARGYTYQQGGHIFYCLNLPGADSTWVYDASTGLWHERTYLNLWTMERHRADWHVNAFGLNIVGDYENGKIYALDPDYTSDDGTSIVRERTAPHFSKNGRRIFHSRFQLDMETGVGLDGSGQGTDPQVMLQYSDDGGHTWSNERWKSAGKIGERRRRVYWNRLGSSYDRVYRVRITDPVKAVLIGAEIDVKEGVA